MLNFGQRSIFRQGGSFLISLPIQWIRTMNPENVIVEIDNEQRIVITSVPMSLPGPVELRAAPTD
ncbi:hypothetical protein DU35_11405 [Methanosarcina mazei]|uniref:SpoVT-AbrB domain-containing protein n=1 Tax=Methanosarcina mazei TaxID=2209 RepID=A0A0F8F4C9_METMZ|nr:hypothetical protein DU35_11405 [Methanosarcina mazei]KKG39388.1 hypothetical protein DU41_16145 [Methanosarcina mazei]KKG46991.1 hypothetical protein DU39_05095 [Methanosarcina mazei]